MDTLIGIVRVQSEVAPLFGCFARSGTRERSAPACSFDKPANMQMEPTRQTVCAILSPRLAAHLQRYTDRERNL